MAGAVGQLVKRVAAARRETVREVRWLLGREKQILRRWFIKQALQRGKKPALPPPGR